MGEGMGIEWIDGWIGGRWYMVYGCWDRNGEK